MKVLLTSSVLYLASAGDIVSGFTDDKMCIEAYDMADETLAVQSFYKHDWEKMKRECEKAFND